MTVNWYRPSQCVLIAVTISSLLFFLGCLACGYLLHFAPEEPSVKLDGGVYTTVPALIFVGAAILTVITLTLGCYGACRDSKLALFVFAVLALVIAAIVLGSSSTVFSLLINNGPIHNKLFAVSLQDLKDYSEDNHVEKNIFNKIQSDLKCCGVNSYADWEKENTTWWRERGVGAIAPASCCIKNDTNCNQNSATLRHQGCFHVLLSRMSIVVYAAFGFSIFLALVQILTALMACYGALLIHRYQSYEIL